MENVQSLMEKNSELFRQAYNEKIQLWLDYIFLSWRWWIGVVIIMASLLIWLWISKKSSANRLFYAGFFTSIVTTFLDLTGIAYGLWDYRYELLPSAAYIPWDIFLLPTLVMLLLLFKPQINPWIKAIFLGAITAFVGLPLLAWLQIYEVLNWRYLYSFPIQIVIFLLAHWISRRNQFSKLENGS